MVVVVCDRCLDFRFCLVGLYVGFGFLEFLCLIMFRVCVLVCLMLTGFV